MGSCPGACTISARAKGKRACWSMAPGPSRSIFWARPAAHRKNLLPNSSHLSAESPSGLSCHGRTLRRELCNRLPPLPSFPLQLDTRRRSPYGGEDEVQIANSGEEAGSADSEGRRTWHSQEWLRSPAITATLGTIRKGSCASTRRRLIARAPQNKLVPSMAAHNTTAPIFNRTKSRRRPDPEDGSGQGSSGRGGPSFLRTP